MGKRGARKKTARRAKWLSPSLILYGAMLAMLSISVLREAGQLNMGRPDADQHDTGQPDPGQHDTGQSDPGQPDPGQPDPYSRTAGHTASDTKPTAPAGPRYGEGQTMAERRGIAANESKHTAPLPAPTSRPPAIVSPIRRQTSAELRLLEEHQPTIIAPQPRATETRDPVVTFQARDQTETTSPRARSQRAGAIPLPVRNPTRGSRARQRRAARRAAMAPINAPAAPVATPRPDIKRPNVNRIGISRQDIPNPPPLPSQKPGSKPPTVSNAAPAATAPAAPKPDLWQPAEIEQARAQCQTILAGIKAETEVLPPMKRGPCGTPAPIKLSSIGANPAVRISPPATINCAYAAALHSWVQHKLQPAALELLGARVTKITTMASYACRKRYGRKKGRLSEHARANALDIGGFTLANRRGINVLSSWGPTDADIARAQLLAAEKAVAAQRQAAAVAAKPRNGDRSEASTPGGGAAELAATQVPQKAVARGAMPGTQTEQLGNRPNASGGSTPAGAEGSGGKPRIKTRKLRGRLVQKNDANASAEARFLHRVHAKACGVFGTVLGPEANEAHRNHFHFDLIKRRHRAYCE